ERRRVERQVHRAGGAGGRRRAGTALPERALAPRGTRRCGEPDRAGAARGARHEERIVSAPAIGFIGFGEAAFWISKGLREAGVTTVVAFDVQANAPAHGDLIRWRAAESGTQLLASAADVAARSDIVFSAVTAGVAQAVGEHASLHLDARHLF